MTTENASALTANPAGQPPSNNAAANTPPVAPPNNAATPPASPVAPPAAPPAGGSWLDKLDPEIKTWAESKGWKSPDTADPAAIAQSYFNLEKLFGADKAGRTVQLPKDETDTAALDAIYDKLGRPKDATGYDIKVDGADENFLGVAKGWFHKAGLLPKQAQMVAELYRAAELDAVQKVQQMHADEVEGLQKEWGQQYEQRVEIAKHGVKAAGLDDAAVKAIEAAMGPGRAAKMFEFFGRNYVEAGPPGTDTRTSNPGFAQHTPATAKAKMDALYADKNFMDRYNHGDPKIRAQAMAEMDALAKLAVNAKM